MLHFHIQTVVTYGRTFKSEGQQEMAEKANIPSGNVLDSALARGPQVPSTNRALMWKMYGVFGTRLLMTAERSPFETETSPLASVSDSTTPAASR